MLPPRGVTPHPGVVEESKSPGDGDGGPVVPPESTRSFVVRRRRNAAQTRLKLFIAAVVLLCVGGALPFLLKETAFRGVSVVAVSELSACAVSLLCCGVVLRTYADGPGAYRRHPNRLIVLKTACDGGLNVVVLCVVVWLAAVRCNGARLERHETRKQECFAKGYLSACDGGAWIPAWIPFFTQLFSTSSEAWFFVLLLDLRRSVRNPFYAFESSRRLYGVGAWTLGVASAAVLVAWKRPILYGVIFPPGRPGALGAPPAWLPDIAGGRSLAAVDVYTEFAPHALGRAGNTNMQPDFNVLDFAACWIKDHSAWERVRPSARDLPKWCLFYGPLVAVYAYALYVLWVVRSRLSRGLSSTFAARVRVAAVSVLTVLTYVTYWLVYGALVTTITVLEHLAHESGDEAAAKALYDAAFCVYALWSFHKLTKCWWDLLVWLFANDPALFFEDGDDGRRATSRESSAARGPRSLLDRLCLAGEDLDDPFPADARSRSRSSNVETDDGDDAGPRPSRASKARRRRARRLYDEDVDYSLKPQTNDALRRELLYYVTSGIRQAARPRTRGAEAGGRRARPSDASLSAPDGDRPINLKRRDVGAPIALSLAKLLQLFFWDDALDGGPAERPRTIDEDASSEASTVLGAVETKKTRGDGGGASAPPSDGGWSDRDSSQRHSSWSTQHAEAADFRARRRRVAGGLRRAARGVRVRARRPRAALPRARRAGPRRVRGRSAATAADSESLAARSTAAPSLAPVVEEGYDAGGDGAAIVFVDYKPRTFARVRDRFGVRLEEYANSFRSTQKERFTEGGSSDAFFFYSGDERFMVKSCTRHEFDSLVDMADGYAAYMCEPANGATFVVRLLGAHCLRLYEMAFYFLVMENVLWMEDAARQRRLRRRKKRDVFDVKGSWVNRARAPPRPGRRLTCKHCNRKYTAPEKGDALADFFAGRRCGRPRPGAGPRAPRGAPRVAALPRRRRRPRLLAPPGAAPGDRDHDETFCPNTVGGAHEPQVTLKDNDLNDANRLTLPRGDALAMARQLRRDAAMLEGLGIMDYSLLLGVRSVEYPVDDDAAGDRGDRGDDGSDGDGPARSFGRVSASHLGGEARPCRRGAPVVVRRFYYAGVIDVLQRWTLKKRLEWWVKTRVLRQDRDGISCVPPAQYARRFMDKMADLLSATTRPRRPGDGGGPPDRASLRAADRARP
ncbi:translation initiation factor IF-2 [Aureococcus anophagefferens]|nr:translation initiation factor IF-2 [Aureococcus anophagefferens]